MQKLLTLLLMAITSISHAQNSDSLLIKRLVREVESNHLKPLALDDKLSLMMFQKLKESYDSFTGDELGILSDFQYKLDDDLRNGTTSFVDRMHAILEESNEPTDRKTLLESFLNTYLKALDFQSHYFSPSAKEEWNASFNRSLVGIGVSLEIKEGYPFIMATVPGGPAQLSGEIHAGQKIITIKNTNSKEINTLDKSLKDIVGNLVGELETEVELHLENKDGTTEKVVLSRDKIYLDRLSSFVLESQKGKKTAYLKLPRFYAGEGNYSSDHVIKQLELIEDAGIGQLVLDLRDNHGGSAIEAAKIMGCFLNGGVVMRALYSSGREREIADQDSSMQFSGDLVVLVNEGSGSASELFSSTMQDYNRGLVIGSQTFGKGTIQRFYNLNYENDQPEIGQVKLTIGSFYSACGRSIQFKGVSPDIVTKKPNVPTGEREIANSLQFEDLVLDDLPKPIVQFENKKRYLAKASKRLKNKNKRGISTYSFNLLQDPYVENETAKAARLKRMQHSIAKDEEIAVGLLILKKMPKVKAKAA